MKKGEITINYIVSAVVLLVLLVVILIYTGMLRLEVSNLFGKFMNFITGR